MLEYDPSKRIKPLEALQHPFFSQFMDSEVPKLPTVSVINKLENCLPESMILPMETYQCIKLSESFNDPRTMSLNPTIDHICSQIKTKGVALCRSAKETTYKAKILKEIFSMSLAPEEKNVKQGHNSTQSGSDKELNCQGSNKYVNNSQK